MDPTAALLWESARPVLRPDEVAAALDRGVDLDLAARAARNHGLGPLLWRAIAPHGLSGAAVDAVHKEADLWRARTRLLTKEAVAMAAGPLMDLGVDPIIWKGPAVSSRYPDPALRPMSDIDMIVPSTVHAESVAAMESAGWKQVPSHSGRYDTALSHDGMPGIAVELHFGFEVWQHRANALSSDELWKRRQRAELFGTPVFVLADDDEVVALAAHAGKPWHGFTRLLWATDLAVITPGVDWGAVRERTVATECRTVVAVALRQAALLGVESPWWMTELPASGARRRAIDEVLAPDWPIVEETINLQARLRYALTDRPRRAGTLFVGELLDAPSGRRFEQTKMSFRLAKRMVRHWPKGS